MREREREAAEGAWGDRGSKRSGREAEQGIYLNPGFPECLEPCAWVVLVSSTFQMEGRENEKKEEGGERD